MEHNLVFDLETIPQQTPLTDTQKVQFEKKMRGKGLQIIPDGQPTTKEYDEASRMVRGTDPFLGKIVVIGVLHVADGTGFNTPQKPIRFCLSGDEEKILRDFWEYIKKERFRFISYNGLGFDVPWVIKRSMIYGIRPTSKAFLSTKRYHRWPHFDVMQVLADWDRMDTCPLELACETFGIPSPKDGKINASGVEKAYLEGNIEGIKKYCEKDIISTYKLFKLVDSYQPNN